MDIYIGNLPSSITKKIIEDLFLAHGFVSQVKLIKNRGLAFVTMPKSDHGNQAIRVLNGLELAGHRLVVKKSYSRVRDDWMGYSKEWEEKAEHKT